MGKRELVIVVVFIGLGVLAFRLTAPSSTESSRRFTFDTFADLWRRPETSAVASVSSQGQFPLSPRTSAIRLSSFSNIEIRGERRDDIAWTLRVDASASDEAGAQMSASNSLLQHDDLGDIVALSVRSSGGARQTRALSLRVPARLSVRVDGARQTTIDGLAAVRLENVVGDTSIQHISGVLDGAHHNGDLVIEDVGSMSLTLVASNAVVRRVTGTSLVHARNGHARLEHLDGPATLDVQNQTLIVVEPTDEVRVSGVNATVAIDRPRAPSSIDARRSRVSMTIDRAVPATVFTTDADVALTVPPSAPIELDIVSEAGTIDATSFGLNATETADASRLMHTAGHEARIAIRTQRSSIVIAAGK